MTASLTSQNLAEKMGWGHRTGSLAVESMLREALPSIRWCDLDSHGYMVVGVTAERVMVEWWFVDSVLERVPGERLAARWMVRPGSARLIAAGDAQATEAEISSTASAPSTSS